MPHIQNVMLVKQQPVPYNKIMMKNMLLILVFNLAGCLLVMPCYATIAGENRTYKEQIIMADTIPPTGVMDIISTVINATNDFNIAAVANLYTPNAVIADDEAPYSWNGPTAGVQWVNAVEKACKDNRLTKLKATIEPVNVYQLATDNIYIIVPVNYTGNLPGKTYFTATGAFTFVLRQINGKWMIKSQAWMPKKGIELQ
jgi:hypothetical protein